MTLDIDIPIRVSNALGMKKIVCGVSIFLSGCAVLHHYQLSEIDNRPGATLTPVEVKVSETGVDLREAKAISQALLSNPNDKKNAGSIADTIALFQIGPRTGAPVYSETYAEKLIYQVHSQCPTGKLTGLVSIRESREYPIIKGEIVKIQGFCLQHRSPSSVELENEGAYQ